MGRKKKLIDGTIRLLIGRVGRRSLFALIDREDWKLAAIQWRPLRSSTGDFYAWRTICLGIGIYHALYLHREVMQAADGVEVDHRNGDTLDCRRSNLRSATRVQNARNGRVRRASNTSGYKGVSATPHGRWRACIVVHARQIWLGSFRTKLEAAGAYDSAALSMFGEFARTNGGASGA